MPATLPNPNNRSSNPVHHSHACYVTIRFNQYHTKCYFTASTRNYDKFVPQDLKEPKHCSKRGGHAVNRLIFHLTPVMIYFLNRTNIDENAGKVITKGFSVKLFLSCYWSQWNPNFSGLKNRDSAAFHFWLGLTLNLFNLETLFTWQTNK